MTHNTTVQLAATVAIIVGFLLIAAVRTAHEENVTQRYRSCIAAKVSAAQCERLVR